MVLAQLVNAAEAIAKISRQPLPMGTLYKVSRQIDRIRPHLEFYDGKREEILRKYCGEPTDGRYKIPEGEREKLMAELNDLCNVEAEKIEGVTVPADKEMRLSYDDLAALRGIIDFAFDEEAKKE